MYVSGGGQEKGNKRKKRKNDRKRKHLVFIIETYQVHCLLKLLDIRGLSSC